MTSILAGLAAFSLGSDTVEGASYGVDLRLSDPVSTKPLVEPDPVIFNLTVEHTGTALTEWVEIAVRNESETWNHTLSAMTGDGLKTSTSTLRIILDVGEVATLQVFIDADPSSDTGTYILAIVAVVEENTDESDAYPLGVVIPQMVDFEVIVHDPPPGGEYAAEPPATISIDFDLYNLGNAEDRFLLQASASLSSVGWTATITSGADGVGWTPDLPPDQGGESPHRVVVEAHMPAGAHPDDVCTISLKATSYSAPSALRTPARIGVRSQQVHSFTVAVIGPDELGGKPGSGFDFTFKVTNTGNGEDTFRIYATYDEEQAPGFDVTVDPDRVTLDHMENVTVVLSVQVPTGSAMGKYVLGAEVHSSEMGSLPQVRTVTLNVEQSYALSVTSEDPSKEVGLGDRVAFVVRVRNVGNGVDSMVVETSGTPPQWLTYTQPPSFTLVAGESADVELMVYIPEVLEGKGWPSYAMRVWANSTRGPASDHVTLTMVIAPFHRPEWVIGNDTLTSPKAPVVEEGTVRPKPVIDLYQGSSVRMDLVLRNMGNVDDNVSIEVLFTDPRMTVHVVPWEAFVRAGEDLEVAVTIVVQDNMLPGEHRFWLNATSEDSTVAARVLPVEFDVFPIYNPIDFVDQTYGDPLNDDFTYSYITDGSVGPVTGASGRRGADPAVDIISVTAILDLETSTVTVTLELKGLAVTQEGVRYEVYFVNDDHRLTGALLDPRAHHQRGAFQWEDSNWDNVIFSMYLEGDRIGSSSTVVSLQVEVLADKVHFLIGAGDLRYAGVDIGSDFKLYAYAHRIGGDDEVDGRLTWDTAGHGAAPAPAAFDDMPEEASSETGVAVVVVVAALVAAVVTALFLFRRWWEAQKLPPDDHDPDQWVEFE